MSDASKTQRWCRRTGPFCTDLVPGPPRTPPEATLLLLTWNLNKNPVAFRLALAHLRHNLDCFIACFQELPLEASTTARARDATKQLVGDSISCLGVTPAASPSKHGRVGIFCSPGFRPQAPDVAHDPRQRMAIISVLDARAQPFLLMGYHGESRRDSPTEAQ